MAIIGLKNSQIGHKWAEIFLAISCPSILWDFGGRKGRRVGQSRSAAECFLSLSVNKEPATLRPLIGIIPAPPVTERQKRGDLGSEGMREGGLD